MIICPACGSEECAKKGWLKTKKQPRPIRQYQCKNCKRRFSANSLKETMLQKKPWLNKQIMALYCEGNTLRGISRLLNVSYKTVIRKWRFMAEQARKRHLQALLAKEIVTTYIQFDEIETFEASKKQPLGIELSIRAKTGQILSAKVCRIPIKALSISKPQSIAYNRKVNREEVFKEMLQETARAIKDGYAVLSCDGNPQSVKLARIMCPESLVKTHVNDYDGMWRLNHTCAKL